MDEWSQRVISAVVIGLALYVLAGGVLGLLALIERSIGGMR